MSYTMRLRTSAFAKAATLAGFRADYRLAQVMEVNWSTVTRMVAGILPDGFGGDKAAQILAAVRKTCAPHPDLTPRRYPCTP